MNGSDRTFEHLRRFLMNGIAVCIWPLIAVQSPSLNADDLYLEALQNEAKARPLAPASKRGTLMPSKTSSSSSPAWSVDSQSAEEELPPKLSKKGFEQALKDRFYGTFMFYRQLTGYQRNTVYAVYQRNPKVEVVRKKVVDLLKKQ